MADNLKQRLDLAALVATWSDDYKKATAPLIDTIYRELLDGATPEQAVIEAFRLGNLEGKLANQLLDVMGVAAAQAIGPGVTITPAGKAKLMELPWTADRMPLSQRLHGADAVMRQKIVDQIQGALKQGQAWKDTAKRLYDGYGFPTTINRADLPIYLQTLLSASRTMNNGADLRAALRRARSQIRLLGEDGAPNRALKAAYKQIARAVEIGADKKIQNAIKVGLEEKSRYHAERIARTELSRAWSEGFWAEYGDDDLTVAVRWKLSSRHPNYDICDFHAKANLFGMGPGIYPKDLSPAHPAHPHCTCRLAPVFKGEVGFPDRGGAKRRGDDFLKKLSLEERQRLLTIEGEKAWRAGQDWQGILRGFTGHGDQRIRLTKQDFTPAPAPAPAPTGLKQKIEDLKKKAGATFGGADDLIAVGKLIDEEIRKHPALAGSFQAEADALQLSNQRRDEYRAAEKQYKAGKIPYDEILRLYNEYLAAHKAHQNLAAAGGTAHAEALKAALSQIREVGPLTAQAWAPGSKTDAKALFAEMAKYMPRDWLETSAPSAILAKTVKRGYYAHYGYKQNLYPEYALSGDRSVAAHEFGHRVEHIIPGILSIEKEYYDRRTAGEPLVWLGSGYKSYEKARKDNFTKAYIGKDYGGRNYEILSMGLEGAIFGENGLGVNTKDPETRQFILGIMGVR